jgi:hypothetical protein
MGERASPACAAATPPSHSAQEKTKTVAAINAGLAFICMTTAPWSWRTVAMVSVRRGQHGPIAGTIGQSPLWPNDNAADQSRIQRGGRSPDELTQRSALNLVSKSNAFQSNSSRCLPKSNFCTAASNAAMSRGKFGFRATAHPPAKVLRSHLRAQPGSEQVVLWGMSMIALTYSNKI